jgi:hypothetical protein
MRSNVLPSSAPPAAVRPQRLLVLCRGAACPAQASTLASTPAFLARPAPSASGCSRHSLLVANAVRADQAAPSLSQDTLELISRLTQQVDDTHTDILRRSASPLSAGHSGFRSAQGAAAGPQPVRCAGRQAPRLPQRSETRGPAAS